MKFLTFVLVSAFLWIFLTIFLTLLAVPIVDAADPNKARGWLLNVVGGAWVIAALSLILSFWIAVFKAFGKLRRKS